MFFFLSLSLTHTHTHTYKRRKVERSANTDGTLIAYSTLKTALKVGIATFISDLYVCTKQATP